MKRNSLAMLSCLGGVGLLTPAAVQAACTIYNQSTVLVSPGEVVIKQNAPVGTLIRTSTAPGSTLLLATCTDQTIIDRRYVSHLTPSTAVPGVYKTPLAGLGVKFEWEPPGGGTRVTYPDTETRDEPGPYQLTAAGGTFHTSFYRIEGDFAGGVLDDGGRGASAETVLNGTNRWIQRFRFDSIPFTLATCDLTAGSLNQNVDLTTVTSQHFGADGGSPWKPFELVSESCDLSQFNQATFTFSGNTVPSMPELFEIDPGGGGGVGIQLGIVGGSEIVPGTGVDLPVLGAGGRYAFQARYKRTGARLVKGKAEASVVVHVDYD